MFMRLMHPFCSRRSEVNLVENRFVFIPGFLTPAVEETMNTFVHFSMTYSMT